ncbi:hypothetical protein ACIQPR_46085 [Streptomyces sp. NPDC091280]|uniref:hypothetical protein n=1 Tax=Streptomyces sp. NPDC091280 TaxID=3365984 RepID=UPI0037FD68ED
MPTPHDELSAFATALADRLPGTWSSASPQVDDDSCSLMRRVWDNGHILWAAGYTSMLHILLDGPDRQQLCVFKRPVGRGGEFLVTPMTPTGFRVHQVAHVEEPNGIVVPGDPLRAAVDVARRVLPRYQAAMETVRHNARVQPEPPHRKPAPEPAQTLTLVWYPDGVVGAPYKSVPEDAREVLYICSFQYRPNEAAFALPASYSRAERALFLHAVVRLLTARDIGVNFRHAAPPAPQPPGCSPVPAPGARPPAGTASAVRR